MPSKLEQLQKVDISSEANRLWGRMKGEEAIHQPEAKLAIRRALQEYHQEVKDGTHNDGQDLG